MLNDTSAHDTLWKLIKDMRFGMLTHRTATGMLHSPADHDEQDAGP